MQNRSSSPGSATPAPSGQHSPAASRGVSKSATSREARWRAIVSGAGTGPSVYALRLLFGLVAFPYGIAVWLRNLCYDWGWFRTHRVEAPVICVGNLTLGGTGKTPLVAWLCRTLRQQGLRVAVVSRGYAAGADGRNDEALELEQQLPDVPHVQHRDRVAGAQLAIEELESQCIVLDDGFQHRRLSRDLDLVLLDACAPWGYGHLFPRGALREFPRGLRRAQAVVLSRADMASAELRQQVQQQVRRLAPQAAWIEVRHCPERLISAHGASCGLDSVRGRRVAAFCGIGNPDGFRHTVQSLNVDLVGFREFPDHFAYQRADIEGLVSWLRQISAEMVLCTHKDLVKVGLDQLGDCPLWAVAVGLEFLSGRETLEAMLRARIGPAADSTTA